MQVCLETDALIDTLTPAASHVPTVTTNPPLFPLGAVVGGIVAGGIVAGGIVAVVLLITGK